MKQPQRILIMGYKIEQESFDDNIHSISATKIRQQMGL
jgi:hypothetical protein